MNNNLPKDFDWQYYLDAHPDLTRAGLYTEEHAIVHYISHGRSEKRPYKKFLPLMDATDFDPTFYLSEYPDVGSYYNNSTHIPQKDKLLHHYIYHGKHEGRFKNKIEQEQALVDTDQMVSNLIKLENLTNPQNKLECICLLTTANEVDSGQCQKFLQHLIDSTKNSYNAQQISFKIILNKESNNNNNIDISGLIEIFLDVEIINLQLSGDNDLYTDTLQADQPLPKYGLKSGPNCMFFETISRMSVYNTIGLLETDCLLGQNWIDNLYYYTKYVNGFLISGGLYDGSVGAKASSAMINHINGGTALYATNNHILQGLIKLLDILLQKQISNNMPGLAYDYALKLMIDHNLNNVLDHASSNMRMIWQFIYRNYLPCKLIINCSTDRASDTDINLLKEKYNYSILHIKNKLY